MTLAMPFSSSGSRKSAPKTASTLRHVADHSRKIVRSCARLQNGPRFVHVLPTLSGDKPKLGEMPTQGIDHLRPLSDQQIPQPEDHAEPLLFRGLHLDETHSRSTARLCNGFGIRHVVFLALHIRLDEFRSDQAHVMPDGRQGPRPMVGRSAGFHRNDALGVRLHESQKLPARQLLAKHDLALCCRSVQLKDLFRQVSVEAPGATLNILHARETEIVDRLRNRDVECVILGNPSLNDPHLEKHVLIADRMVCAGWSGNPSLVDMSRAKYLAADHLQISADGQAEGATDLALREMNLSRRVVATVPHYLVAPWIIRGTSLITTFGDSVLLALTPESETVIFDPPIPLPDVLLTLIYERYLDADPGHVWLRELIGTVAREVQYAKARVAPALQRS